jgi:hypothetical protein
MFNPPIANRIPGTSALERAQRRKFTTEEDMFKG